MNDFEIDSIPVPVTFDGLGFEPVVFHLRPYLSAEERKDQQAYIALSATEREEREFEYSLRLLCKLIVKLEGNIKNFDFLPGETVKSAVARFFGDGNPLKRDMILAAMGGYMQKIRPAEFFRGF